MTSDCYLENALEKEKQDGDVVLAASERMMVLILCKTL